MCKTARNSALIMALGLILALPFQAHAVTYEDSFENCSYPKMVDLMLIRPVGFATALLGTAFFVMPLAPVGFLMVPDEMGTIASTLVGKPFAFVFDRPLGQCNSVTLDF